MDKTMTPDKSVEKGMEHIAKIISKNYDKHNYFNHYKVSDVEEALKIAVQHAREELLKELCYCDSFHPCQNAICNVCVYKQMNFKTKEG